MNTNSLTISGPEHTSPILMSSCSSVHYILVDSRDLKPMDPKLHRSFDKGDITLYCTVVWKVLVRSLTLPPLQLGRQKLRLGAVIPDLPCRYLIQS